MNNKRKNIVSLVLSILTVGFLLFALMYWLFGFSYNNAIDAAIAGTLGGFFAPYLMKYFNKIVQKKSR